MDLGCWLRSLGVVAVRHRPQVTTFLVRMRLGRDNSVQKISFELVVEERRGERSNGLSEARNIISQRFGRWNHSRTLLDEDAASPRVNDEHLQGAALGGFEDHLVYVLIAETVADHDKARVRHREIAAELPCARAASGHAAAAPPSSVAKNFRRAM